MWITCPKCNLSKEASDHQIPPAGVAVTCPRCHTRFDIKPERRMSRSKRLAFLFGVAVVFLCVVVTIFMYDGRLDKNYFLEPGFWQGEMTFAGKKYPFVLVIETAQDGRLKGYMDWTSQSPRYRLAIRGTYVGNHLLFEDYEFLERKADSGLYDKQDVYIFGDTMAGLAKNGRAALTATKRPVYPL